MLKELVEQIVRSLAEKKDAIVVTETERDGTRFFEIKVDQVDLGRIIGKSGQTIRAIRALLSVAHTGDQPVAVDVVSCNP
jgi:predicted RNA-binding protein YlqC (UPF0109 family)